MMAFCTPGPPNAAYRNSSENVLSSQTAMQNSPTKHIPGMKKGLFSTLEIPKSPNPPTMHPMDTIEQMRGPHLGKGSGTEREENERTMEKA